MVLSALKTLTDSCARARGQIHPPPSIWPSPRGAPLGGEGDARLRFFCFSGVLQSAGRLPFAQHRDTTLPHASQEHPERSHPLPRTSYLPAPASASRQLAPAPPPRELPIGSHAGGRCPLIGWWAPRGASTLLGRGLARGDCRLRHA